MGTTSTVRRYFIRLAIYSSWSSLLLPGRSAHAADASPPPPVVTIDPAHHLQKFEGWGTSLCWWAKVAGGCPQPDRQHIADQIFDPATGLGFNVVRYNIGGGEDPQLSFLTFRAAVPGYEPKPGVWDWDADANQRWMLQAAIKRGADHLEAFSNSPPCWMTISGSVTGAANGGSNLAPTRYPDFAQYLATVVQHFHDQWGITFTTLDPLNEPISKWWKRGGHQEGCHFDHAEQARILQLTGQALAERHLTTQLSASDENSIDDAVRSFNALPPDCKAMVAQINTHTYNGSQRQQLRQLAAQFGKVLSVSEYGDNDPTGLKMSQRILIDMKQLQPATWVMWQVADTSRGWGLFRSHEINETYDWQVNEKFYVMGNYSRFIRPGCQMLEVNDENSLAGFDVQRRRLVIVTTNTTGTERSTDFDIAALGFKQPALEIYRTSDNEQLAKLPVGEAAHLEGGLLHTSAAPRSVTTYLVR